MLEKEREGESVELSNSERTRVWWKALFARSVSMLPAKAQAEVLSETIVTAAHRICEWERTLSNRSNNGVVDTNRRRVSSNIRGVPPNTGKPREKRTARDNSAE